MVDRRETIEAGGGKESLTGLVMEARKKDEVMNMSGEIGADHATAEVRQTSAKVNIVEKMVTTVEEVKETEKKKKKKKQKRKDEVKSGPVDADASDRMVVDQVETVQDNEKTTQERMNQKTVESVKLGPKVFNTSEEMFSYFYHLLHGWNLDENFNQHEYVMLKRLVTLSDRHKVAEGIVAFQVRIHPDWQRRSYILIRKDGSEDYFSFRKCVNTLMPLPKDLYDRNGKLNLENLFPEQRNAHNQVKRGNVSGKVELALHGQHRSRCPWTWLQCLWWRHGCTRRKKI